MAYEKKTVQEYIAETDDKTVEGFNDNQENRIDNAFSASEISSGSDTNGSWIKFPDGTMIVYRDVEVALEDEKLKYRDLSLPQSFINSNYNIQFTSNKHGWGFVITARAETSSVFSVQVSRTNNTTHVFKGTVLCIGKWK